MTVSVIERPPLISSQRYLDEARVEAKMLLPPERLIVRVFRTRLRGRWYRIVVDGHHALAAARRLGIEPVWQPPNRAYMRVVRRAVAAAAMGIDWMDRACLTQAIPPVMTTWIGRWVREALHG